MSIRDLSKFDYTQNNVVVHPVVYFKVSSTQIHSRVFLAENPGLVRTAIVYSRRKPRLGVLLMLTRIVEGCSKALDELRCTH